MHRDGAYLGTWENYKNTLRYSILELAVILIRWPKKGTTSCFITIISRLRASLMRVEGLI
jgi:hypothetical protein